MRNTIIAGGVAALSIAVLGGVALAQSAEPARGHRGDADGDGRISQAEFVQQRVARLSSADVDRDGTVAAPEALAAHEARRAERMSGRFDRLDADRDGSLSRTEFEAQQAARVGRGHHRRAERMAHRMERRGPVSIEQAQTRATERFTRLDADHDGYLTVEERRAGREHRREGREARQAERASQATPAAE